MPDEEKKTVDLDTSGPAMDVDVPETPEAGVIEEKEVIIDKPSIQVHDWNSNNGIRN